MKLQFDVLNSWKEDWGEWRVIHWFCITVAFEPIKEFDPFLELHVWILNFDFRLMILKKEEK